MHYQDIKIDVLFRILHKCKNNIEFRIIYEFAYLNLILYNVILIHFWLYVITILISEYWLIISCLRNKNLKLNIWIKNKNNKCMKEKLEIEYIN